MDRRRGFRSRLQTRPRAGGILELAHPSRCSRRTAVFSFGETNRPETSHLLNWRRIPVLRFLKFPAGRCRHGGLSEFSVVVIISPVPFAQSLQRPHRRCTYVTHPNGQVAQSVERSPEKAGVGGSI